jgi:hypothetical protein
LLGTGTTTDRSGHSLQEATMQLGQQPRPLAGDVAQEPHWVAVEVPGVSGYDRRGERAARVSEALRNPRVQDADEVVVTLPVGDHEGLAVVRQRLQPQEVHVAGASVICICRRSAGAICR